MSQNVNYLEIVQFKKAQEFINYLRVTNGHWLWNYPVIGGSDKASPDWNAPWIFRGQGNAEWALIPSAWRKTNIDFLKSLYKRAISITPWNQLGYIRPDAEEPDRTNEALIQCQIELFALVEFLTLANNVGHSTPEAQKIHDLYDKFTNGSNKPFYEDIQHLSLFSEKFFFPIHGIAVALAQHHGIPTRLLDWTTNPLVAAYFATIQISPTAIDGHLAVWAIRRHHFGYAGISELEIERSKHPYLHAQSGIFTYMRNPEAYYRENGRWPSIEDLVNHYPAPSSKFSGVFRKVILPVTEAGELLRLLWAERITQAHLMPTYDNVANALKTKWAWFHTVKLTPQEDLPQLIFTDLVNAVNNKDIDGLMNYITDDHQLYLLYPIEIIKYGREDVRQVWLRFFNTINNYQIVIQNSMIRETFQVLSTGYIDSPELEKNSGGEFSKQNLMSGEKIICVAQYNEGRISSWHMYPDTRANRDKLNID